MNIKFIILIGIQGAKKLRAAEKSCQTYFDLSRIWGLI